MKSSKRTLGLLVPTIVAALCGTAAAQPVPPGSVVLLGAETTNAAARYADIRNKLLATGQFPEVVSYPVTGVTPTLEYLQQFSSVLLWSNGSFLSGEELGNVLADYVDGGGGVVVAVHANISSTVNRFLAGRWDDSYRIITQACGNASAGSHYLGTILVPGHPILENVNTFAGVSGLGRPSCTTLTSHGQKVALWEDDKTLVAVSTTRPNRVDLGSHPASTDSSASNGWIASTDGAILFANALRFVQGGGPPVCYANCDGSTTPPILNVEDFTCFINEFAAAQSLPHEQQLTHYANCDQSTTAPVLNVEDFTCFINQFAQGCR
jgi:hypothetical protein